MKLYVFNVEESYKHTIIGHLVSSGTSYLLLHIVHCWRACTVYKEKRYLPMVPYFSNRVYKYYSCLGRFKIKHNEEGKCIHNKIFKNMPHFILKNVFVSALFNIVFFCVKW